MAQGLIAGDPARQWEWHEAHRDLAKNMYRTSYADASHFRECHVKSDFPSGYGGHIPSLRHDILHRNTQLDRDMLTRKVDPSRDTHPSFAHQITGVPSCPNPRGSKTAPSYKVVRHSGSTTDPKPPYGLSTNWSRQGLNQRTVPPTMKRSYSAPQVAGAAICGSAPTSPVGTYSPGQLSPGTRLQQSVDLANAESQRRGTVPETQMLYDNMQPEYM